jgi:hypothetical protein
LWSNSAMRTRLIGAATLAEATRRRQQTASGVGVA